MTQTTNATYRNLPGNDVLDLHEHARDGEVHDRDYTGADLTWLTFESLDFYGVNFSGCKLPKMTNCNFRYCTFDNTVMDKPLNNCLFKRCSVLNTTFPEEMHKVRIDNCRDLETATFHRVYRTDECVDLNDLEEANA